MMIPLRNNTLFTYPEIMVLVLMRFFIQGDEERAYKTQQGREQKQKRVK